jgi:hypothetical protein
VPEHPGVGPGQHEDFLNITIFGTWNDSPGNALPKGYIAEFDRPVRKCFR